MNPGEGKRVSRERIQEFIDLLVAYRDGASIQIGGYRNAHGEVIIDGDWQPCSSVYLDLCQPAFTEYKYRVVK